MYEMDNVIIHIDNQCQYMTILVNFGVCNLIIYGFMNLLHAGGRPPPRATPGGRMGVICSGLNEG